jgi:hypothetical protein
MIGAPRLSTNTLIFEIEIELEEVQPVVRRRIQIPGEARLSVLHDVVQSVMGWTNSQPHEFVVDGTRYGVPDPDWDDGLADEATVKLRHLTSAGDQLHYVYDFADNWAHTLTVRKVMEPEPGVWYPRCVSGRAACPPEGVGGPTGYRALQEALADPFHPHHYHALDRVGPFDPNQFDLTEVNLSLYWLVWRPRSDQSA